MTPSIGDIAARYEQAVMHKRKLESELRQCNQLVDELEREMVDAMASAGLQSIATATSTIYLARELWARPQPGMEDELIAALDNAGLGDMARRRLMVQQLSALVRQWMDDDGALPEWAEGLIDIDEKVRARVRSKAGRADDD